eukprot:1846523-Pleurochrysis_carterae.AAC.2
MSTRAYRPKQVSQNEVAPTQTQRTLRNAVLIPPSLPPPPVPVRAGPRRWRRRRGSTPESAVDGNYARAARESVYFRQVSTPKSSRARCRRRVGSAATTATWRGLARTVALRRRRRLCRAARWAAQPRLQR